MFFFFGLENSLFSKCKIYVIELATVMLAN